MQHFVDVVLILQQKLQISLKSLLQETEEILSIPYNPWQGHGESSVGRPRLDCLTQRKAAIRQH